MADCCLHLTAPTRKLLLRLWRQLGVLSSSIAPPIGLICHLSLSPRAPLLVGRSGPPRHIPYPKVVHTLSLCFLYCCSTSPSVDGPDQWNKSIVHNFFCCENIDLMFLTETWQQYIDYSSLGSPLF